MPNAFSRKVAASIGATPVTIGGYTVPADTQVTVIGLSLANRSAASVTADVVLSNGGTDYFVIKAAPIPLGGSLVLFGGDQKLVMQPGDSVKVTSSAASSVDAILSILEIT